MKRRSMWVATALLVALPSPARAQKTYEALEKKSEQVFSLKRVLRPFVATCSRKRTYFRRLFCTALNERLKAQHQAKIYKYTAEPKKLGPLIAEFSKGRGKKAASLELTVRGCITCKKPMLDRAGGDITKARFFVFQLPKRIRYDRRRGVYDMGSLEMASYKAELPANMDRKAFDKEVLPHLRADLLIRPVAGVTRVGRGRFKYGVITFELAGHRVYHKCTGKVYGAVPPMKGKYLVDKNDLSCPQNQPKAMVKAPKLPTQLPRALVRRAMESVAADLHTCYNQFGKSGKVSTDIVVASNGKVKIVKVVGDLAGSATAKCVERLVKNADFPKFKGRTARLQWPFTIKR
ncbi:MAG: hypothetical protein KC503_47040 [Myxococcales bacterium]|nr:hypothetical protein [Myxococcales bacterium]